MRRVLISAALAAFAVSGLNAGGASAAPAECNNPKTQRVCEILEAITNIGGTPPVPTIECNNPKYARACETVRDLIGSGA